MKELNVKEIRQIDECMFFGYGSLMYPHGINGRGMLHKYINKDLTPVVVKGFKRSMCALVMYSSYYGIYEDKNSAINGVIFPINSFYDLDALLYNEGAAPIVPGYVFPDGKTVYRTIDITDTIPSKVRKGRRVLTLLCDKLHVDPMQYNWRYIQRVHQGVEMYRTAEFMDDFLNTGGVHPATYTDMVLHNVQNNKHRTVHNSR